MHRRRQRRRRRGVFRRRVRARRHGFPFDCRAAASSTMPSSRASAGRPIPIPGRAATNACRNIFPTNAARSAATRAPPRRSATAVREAGMRGAGRLPPAASTISKWRRIISRAASATSSARRASRSPIPTGSARSGSGFGAEVRRVRIHQLLRGARPEAQAGHLPALGQAAPVASGEHRTADGKRRLTAPAWQPPDQR